SRLRGRTWGGGHGERDRPDHQNAPGAHACLEDEDTAGMLEGVGKVAGGRGVGPLLDSCSYSLPAATGLGEQPEYLEIDPDERDHQAERPVPLEVFRGATLHAGLDEIEVED